MSKYSLNNDIEIKVSKKTEINVDEATEINVDEDEKWAMSPEPEIMEEVDNVRLDPDAMARYLEIRKAREESSRAQGYHHH